jgi:hypothetical protein
MFHNAFSFLVMLTFLQDPAEWPPVSTILHSFADDSMANTLFGEKKFEQPYTKAVLA